jgi:hypothetical protein
VSHLYLEGLQGPLTFPIILSLFTMDIKNSAEMTEKFETIYNAVETSEATHRAERRLRRKTGLFVMPTVVLLYLMCFIDRANIGKHFPSYS